MPGLRKIIQGVLTYRATVKKDLVKQFERIRDRPAVGNFALSRLLYVVERIVIIERCQQYWLFEHYAENFDSNKNFKWK